MGTVEVSKTLLGILIGAGTMVWSRGAVAGEHDARFNATIAAYIEARIAEFARISPDRKARLEELARYVQGRVSPGRSAKLTFICTHNSRRSHMSQLWAAVASARYGIDEVETYSGGTERTAFNPRAIAALERAGFEITQRQENTSVASENPPYTIAFAADREPLVCFSKVYDSDPNPSSDFCAVMTCSEADENCPAVRGAEYRVNLPFEDPKVADGTPQEVATYDERCAQIAREMLFAFSRIK
jgi:arsenate reductase (thioredoxin)